MHHRFYGAPRGEDDLVGLIVLVILTHKGYIKLVMSTQPLCMMRTRQIRPAKWSIHPSILEIFKTWNWWHFVVFVIDEIPPPHHTSFVIFSPHMQFLIKIFSIQKCVNCDNTDFATKQRKSRQNRFYNNTA